MKSSVESSISAQVYLVLSEFEARALLAITAYGVDAFIDCFFKNLGKAYLEDHVDGLKALFKSIGPIEVELKKIDKAREGFNKGANK